MGSLWRNRQSGLPALCRVPSSPQEVSNGFELATTIIFDCREFLRACVYSDWRRTAARYSTASVASAHSIPGAFQPSLSIIGNALHRVDIPAVEDSLRASNKTPAPARLPGERLATSSARGDTWAARFGMRFLTRSGACCVHVVS